MGGFVLHVLFCRPSSVVMSGMGGVVPQTAPELLTLIDIGS